MKTGDMISCWNTLTYKWVNPSAILVNETWAIDGFNAINTLFSMTYSTH
jgi:hypothetical protein